MERSSAVSSSSLAEWHGIPDSVANDVVRRVERLDITDAAVTDTGQQGLELLLGAKGVSQHPGPLRLVCKDWARQAASSVDELQPSGKDAPKGWAGSFCHVRQLDLSGCNGLRVKGADLRHLSLLRELCMPSSATDADLGAAAPSLRETLVLLDLSLCRRVTDEGIREALRHLTGLTELGLAGCSAVTGDCLRHVSQLPSLTTLSLSSCPASTSPDALALLPAGKIQRLLLDDNPWVGDEAVETLASTQPNLTALSLQLCPLVTDQGATKLASLPRLLSLSLSGCPGITDATADALGRLTSLEELSLAWCTKLTDTAAASLSSLKQLESLSLGGCESMTDSAAREIGRNHPALTSLCLEDASLTDACCLDLSRAKALRRLDLNGCRALTAACLPVLVGSLPSLISLDMRGTRIAPESAESLRESHPQLCLAVCFTDLPP